MITCTVVAIATTVTIAESIVETIGELQAGNGEGCPGAPQGEQDHGEPE